MCGRTRCPAGVEEAELSAQAKAAFMFQGPCVSLFGDFTQHFLAHEK